MLRLLPKPKGLLPKSMRSLPKKMPPSRQLSTATRISSPQPCKRFLLPASTFNVPWDRGAQVTRHTTAVLVRWTSFHNYYLVNHYYYNLVPMVPAVNKQFFKSFDLISRQCYLVLKPILSWKCRCLRCRPQLVLTTWFRVFPTRRPDTADVSATSCDVEFFFSVSYVVSLPNCQHVVVVTKLT
jgi:hypothetical protein